MRQGLFATIGAKSKTLIDTINTSCSVPIAYTAKEASRIRLLLLSRYYASYHTIIAK